MTRRACAHSRRPFVAGDPLRAIAAVSVLLFHVAAPAFVTAARQGDPAPFGDVLSPLIVQLSLGIYVFFVLSGYLLSLATDEQQARWFPKFCSGEMITAIAMTEPGTGSDLQGIKTTAVLDGDEYVINGSKTFITNGINADFVIVVCQTDPSAGALGFSLIAVERGAEGFERGRNLDKIGLKVGDICQITDEDGSTGLGIAWRAADRMGTSPKVPPAKMSDALRETFGFKQGTQITISKCDKKITRAQTVSLTDVTPSDYDGTDDGSWVGRCRYLLSEFYLVALAISLLHILLFGFNANILYRQL